MRLHAYRQLLRCYYPLGVLASGGPLNATDFADGGLQYCTAACYFIYAPWVNIENALGRVFIP